MTPPKSSPVRQRAQLFATIGQFPRAWDRSTRRRRGKRRRAGVWRSVPAALECRQRLELRADRPAHVPGPRTAEQQQQRHVRHLQRDRPNLQTDPLRAHRRRVPHGRVRRSHPASRGGGARGVRVGPNGRSVHLGRLRLPRHRQAARCAFHATRLRSRTTTIVAARRSNDFANKSLVRIPSQLRAELESPRVRVPEPSVWSSPGLKTRGWRCDPEPT